MLATIQLYFNLLLLCVFCYSCNSPVPQQVFINAAFTVEPQNYLTINTELAFKDRTTISEGGIISWEWDFGDGNTSLLKNPVHTYTMAKTYSVSLKVKDVNQNSKTFTKSLVVSDPNKGLRRLMYQSSDSVYICAHRAVHSTLSGGDFPENSMTAILMAINNNIDMIEIDVRFTADGVLVLMHDATVDRTTNGTGTLSTMNYDEVKKLKLRTYSSRELTSDTVPTLKQVLALTKGKIFVNIDINNAKAPVGDVLKLVREFDMIDDVMFFTSSTLDVSYLMSSGAIAMPSCYNNDTFGSYIQANLKPLIFQTDINGFNEEWLLMKAAGIRIFCNLYMLNQGKPTADNWSQLNSCIQNGVKFVQTDYPIEMVNYLKSR
jgi:glycerophosphoryl diester phosphodiesterase